MSDRLASTFAPEVLAEVDAFIYQGDTRGCREFILERSDWSFWEAWDATLMRRAVLRQLYPDCLHEWRQWLSQAHERLERLERAPVAVEALWEGDPRGWSLVLAAILTGTSEEHPRFTRVHLVTMRGSGEHLRLLGGRAPPWPESGVALSIGRSARERWGSCFHFPSPDEPIHQPPRWWEQ